MTIVIIFNWIVQHWLDIGSVIAGIIAIASIIVKLTPTPNDDSILAKIIAFLKVIGLNKEKK